MSRNHCGYCGTLGHNRTTCRHLNEFIRNNPDSWQALDAAAINHNRKTKKCSYCKSYVNFLESWTVEDITDNPQLVASTIEVINSEITNHNAAGCSHARQHMDTDSFNIREYRAETFSAMAEAGIGVGAMISRPRFGGEVEVGIITKILWENILPPNLSQTQKILQFNTLKKSSYYWENTRNGRLPVAILNQVHKNLGMVEKEDTRVSTGHLQIISKIDTKIAFDSYGPEWYRFNALKNKKDKKALKELYKKRKESLAWWPSYTVPGCKPEKKFD
tara:strand:- start:212 stop:1036 length:825 start_codon:yes stop_codon:yes gene_type:complete